MKTILQNVLGMGTLLALALGSQGFSQGAEQSSGTQTSGGYVVRGSKLVHAKVFTPQGEHMGDIEDVLLDPKTGKIADAVLGIGGWLGIGEKRVIIPWQLVQPDPQKPENYVVQSDKEKLRGAPSFEGDQWATVTQPDYLARVQSYFGVSAQPGQPQPQQAQQSQPQQQRTAQQQTQQEEQRRMQQAQEQAHQQAQQITQQQAQQSKQRAEEAQRTAQQAKQRADEAQRTAQQAQQRAQQETEQARQAQQAAQQVQQQNEQQKQPGAQVGTQP